MTNETHRKPDVPSERLKRLWPSWRRRVARLAVVCLCVVIIEKGPDIARLDQGGDCAAATHDERSDVVQVCEQEFRRTQDPATGARLAKVLMSHDRAAAKQIAKQLLSTPRLADALYVLGWIAQAEGHAEEAIGWLEVARALHRIQSSPGALARDDGVLAAVRTNRSEFAEALRLIDECITESQLDGDNGLKIYCHLAAVKTLVQVGYWLAAKHELDIVESLGPSKRASSDIEYQRGNYEQEQAQHASAIAMFEKALQYGKHVQNDGWIITTELNLAYSYAEQGNFDRAQDYLDSAARLDSDNQHEPERTWATAQIAYRQHDPTRAASLIEKYFQLPDSEQSEAPDGRDDASDVANLGARIALERNDLERAEYWARRGAGLAEDVRRTQSVLELRSWVLAKRRAPYELLFTALARGHQIENAAMVFDEWQGRTVWDALARPRPPASLDYGDMAAQVARLGEWLRAASPQAPFAKSPNRYSVLRTMRDIDLLALVVANDEVWRLTANHGPPRLFRLASLAELDDRVKRFRGNATDVQLASDLGALLLPDDAFRVTREALHVIVDGRLGGLPVAALRRGTISLIEMRPVVRVLRLPESRCVHVNRSGPAIVLADPDDNLPRARVEAKRVADLLHTTSKIGAAATRDALFAAKNASVLHVAAHGTPGNDGAALKLAGGEVSALEISATRVAPSLAVLSACGTATSDDPEQDPELARSLVAGFLGAGSQHVVATLLSVSDAGASEISTRFYREGGVADPARALATVQAELAKRGDNTDWPYFAVFGPDVCPEDAPDRQ